MDPVKPQVKKIGSLRAEKLEAGCGYTITMAECPRFRTLHARLPNASELTQGRSFIHSMEYELIGIESPSPLRDESIYVRVRLIRYSWYFRIISPICKWLLHQTQRTPS